MKIDHSKYTCSFCGKNWANDGVRVVAGPAVYICEDCIGVCYDCLEAYPKADPDAFDITCADAVGGVIPFEDSGPIAIYGAPAVEGPCSNCTHWIGNYNDPTERICEKRVTAEEKRKKGCSQYDEKVSTVTLTFPGKIKEWNIEYGRNAYKDIRLVEKLRESFKPQEISSILEVLENVCSRCWDGTDKCSCSRDD